MPHDLYNPAETARYRPLFTGLLWLGASLLAGTLVAPVIFNALLRVGRMVPRLAALRDIEFESVCSRAILISFIVLAYPVLKQVGRVRIREVTFFKDTRWKSHLGQGLGMGLCSMGLLLVLGWATGAYTWDPAGALGDPVRWITVGVGALLVGLIEEVLFRGMLQGALVRALGCWPGLLLASIIFAAVHFARPLAPEGVVYGYWYSGLFLLPHTFPAGHSTYHYFPYALTLFVIGAVQGLFFLRQGHIYFIVGLHAGWIILMRMGIYGLNRVPDLHAGWFGQSMMVGKTWAALLLCLGFLVYAALSLRSRTTRKPEASC